ncbi:MAG: hypothetical protein ABSH06_25160 [Thermodesulfobacteriota bacterium]
MGKVADVIKCVRLNELIFERECEYHPKNKNCLKCDSELIVGPTSKKLSVYTKYPPNCEFKNAEEVSRLPGYIVVEGDLPPVMHGELSYLKKDWFEETGNPVYALEAFFAAHAVGLYPPLWAIDWLLRAFRSFYKSNGEENINRLLGFSKGRGQDIIGFKKRVFEARNGLLQNEVITLLGVFDVNLTDACKMVAKRIAKFPGLQEKETGMRIHKLSWRTLYDLYSKNPMNKKWEHYNRRHLKWSEQEKGKYLEKYPSDSYEWKRGKLKLRLK